MRRTGFPCERELHHAQRWLEVVVAVCGTDSFVDPAASAAAREFSPGTALNPVAETQSEIVESGNSYTSRKHAVPDAVAGCRASLPISHSTDAAAALRSLLLKKQPVMIDRLGKTISATTLNSFIEVCNCA